MRQRYDHFEIREGGVGDLDAVFDLWQQFSGLALRSEDTPEVFEARLLDGKVNLYVAVSSADIVGAVLVGDDGRRGHLYHLTVAERKQGLGLGRALVDVALGELAARGIARSHVFVQVDNESACAFWEHLGWRMRTELVVFSQVVATAE